jgi:hypothetical protein
MAADLDGVRRKLARARSKLDALQTNVDAYMDPPPFEIAVESQGNRQAIVCRVAREPDESWADEMAEIPYQARSALDVLVGQLGSTTEAPRAGRSFRSSSTTTTTSTRAAAARSQTEIACWMASRLAIDAS